MAKAGGQETNLTRLGRVVRTTTAMCHALIWTDGTKGELPSFSRTRIADNELLSSFPNIHRYLVRMKKRSRFARLRRAYRRLVLVERTRRKSILSIGLFANDDVVLGGCLEDTRRKKNFFGDEKAGGNV